MAVKQTAGRDALGEFAPKFAELNDDVLFGQVWSREDKLSLRDRSLVTVVALMSQGLVDSSFQYHLATARQNGITRLEIAEILTHAAFYAGWPKAWAAFRMAKEVWADEAAADDGRQQHQAEMVFPIGAPNDGFAQYFTGRSYLQPLSTSQAHPPCRSGRRTDPPLRGRTRLVSGVGAGGPGTASRRCGQYPAGGEALARCRGRQLVFHLALEAPGESCSNEWLEPVSDEAYAKLD